MLTKEQNTRFTEVGPGTQMGNLLRRYWMPFATVAQLEQHPTRAVSLLGEHLVAYKDRSGNYGLIQEFCPHRNTNLLWGIPENEGLRCPYHGWLYDNRGNCLEQPAEAPDSTFKDRIHVLHESDAREFQPFAPEGTISTGRAVKYSPIAQERAREAGNATPPTIDKEIVSAGYIHPKE